MKKGTVHLYFVLFALKVVVKLNIIKLATCDVQINNLIIINLYKSCGACHQWGCDPIMENNKCDVCKRTEQQIRNHHGFCYHGEIGHVNLKE